MKTLKSFSDLARVLEKDMKQMQIGLTEAMKTSVIAVVEEAKDEFGEYQHDDMGGASEWAELSDATKAGRVRQGYAADEPLLRNGATRDSIEYKSSEKSFEVGSDSDIAVYQELGTAANPPRPFLAPALHRAIPEILKTVGESIEKSLAGEK